MKVLLDADVLFPTVLREVLTGLATTGAFTPLWSARILEEWARATRKLGPGAEEIARAEIALLRAGWPGAEVEPGPGAEAALSLPDPDDRHVLAAAIAGGAGTLVTRNARDFPARTLGRVGILRRDPDSFLMDWAGTPALDAVLEEVRARAEAASGRATALAPLLKKARLLRLAKSARLADADEAGAMRHSGG